MFLDLIIIIPTVILLLPFPIFCYDIDPLLGIFMLKCAWILILAITNPRVCKQKKNGFISLGFLING